MYIKPLKRSLLSMPRWQAIGGIPCLIIAFGIMGHFDAQDEQAQHERYCEMVKLWKETRGQAGWPAYNSERMCK